jgi:hypothetical protein
VAVGGRHASIVRDRNGDKETLANIITGDVVVNVSETSLAGESSSGSLHVELGGIRQRIDINVGKTELGVGGSTDHIFVVLVVTGTRFTTIELGDQNVGLEELVGGTRGSTVGGCIRKQGGGGMTGGASF